LATMPQPNKAQCPFKWTLMNESAGVSPLLYLHCNRHYLNTRVYNHSDPFAGIAAVIPSPSACIPLHREPVVYE
jgi:hypothetical protein